MNDWIAVATEGELFEGAAIAVTPIDDEGLVHLVEATSIESLTLQSTALSNEGLRSLARLPRFTHLRLKDNPQLDDRALPHLRALATLGSLQVHETSITTAGLAHLASLPALRDLCVDTETGTFAALRELSLRLPRCFYRNGLNHAKDLCGNSLVDPRPAETKTSVMAKHRVHVVASVGWVQGLAGIGDRETASASRA